MTNAILVVAELDGGRVRGTTHSAITLARRLAETSGAPISLLVMGGSGAKGAAESLRGYGAKEVLVCEDAGLEHYLAERYAPIVAQAAAEFEWLVCTASSFGKDLMPRVAARLNAGYAADCSDLEASDAGVLLKRPMFAGNAFGFCSLETPTKVVTARQSEFEPAAESGGETPIREVAAAAPSAAAERIEFVSLDQVKSERPELGEAKVVVSGGRALKERFFEVLEPLADHLGAAIGASRAACDAGYAPGDLQVGQTGKVVAPGLYFAIGISGAIQHVAGMKGSKTIVAINKDPDAPIFQVADYGLVQDLFTAVPELVEALKAG